MVLRRRMGASVQRPTQAPSLAELVPLSTTQIRLLFSSVTGATSYEVYKSTDGINYSLASEVTGSGSIYATIGSLTRQTQYYFKVRAKNAAGVGPFSNVYYTWPTSTDAYNYGLSILQLVDGLWWENTELLYFDMFMEELEAVGLSIASFDNFMPMSPTAGSLSDSVAFFWDLAAGTYQDGVGGSILYYGFDIAYDGYVEIASPPLGSGSSTNSAFYAAIDIESLVAAPSSGYSNRHTLFGVYDGSNGFELSHFNTAGTEFLSITNGNGTSQSATDSFLSMPAGGIMGAGIGLDIHKGNLFVQKNSSSTLSDSLTFDAWPSGENLYLGALNDNGTLNRIMSGIIRGFYMSGELTTETERSALMVAINNFNSNLGR